MTADYIGWCIGIVGIIIAIYYEKQNGKLKQNRQQVHIKAQKVIQNNYFDNAPKEIKQDLDFIVANTGSTVAITLAKKKDNKDRG